MRMLWVTMGMHVPFVAASVTLRRCSCVTSVSCSTECIDRHTCDSVTVL